MDHRAKVPRKEAQIAKWEHQVDQVLPGKERAICKADIPEENRVDVQAQCDREIKMGGKVTRMGEDPNELEKFVIKLRTQEGNVRDLKRAP
jgi:hypothetical protein